MSKLPGTGSGSGNRPCNALADWFALVVAAVMLFGAQPQAHALGMNRVRFVVVDPKTHQPIPAARVVIEDLSRSGHVMSVVTCVEQPSRTADVDLQAWCVSSASNSPTVITIPEGISVTLQTQSAQPPVKDI